MFKYLRRLFINMARKDLTPVVNTLYHEITLPTTAPEPGTPEDWHYYILDSAKALSSVNRRLYEQGRQYYVKNIQFINPSTTALIGEDHWIKYIVSTVPNSWLVHNAWVKAHALWKQERDDALRDTDHAVRGKWEDFKVYADRQHLIGTYSDMPLPEDWSGNRALVDEWNMAKVFVPINPDDQSSASGTEDYDKAFLHMLGANQGTWPNVDSYGMIEEYFNSRVQVDTSPTTQPQVSETLYSRMVPDSATGGVIDDVVQSNDYPPYDMDNPPGGDTIMPEVVIQKYTTTTMNSIANTANTGPFMAPCGLVMIAIRRGLEINMEDTVGIKVDYALGDYKGVLAPPMGQ